MFDIGMSEMVVIGVVALIVVGPKDLPQMFRKVGQFVGKARGMARDFQRAMDQAADESGVGEVSTALKQATSMKNLGLDDAAKHLQDYQADQETKKKDAAAEKAERSKEVEEANKAAGKWPPDYMTDAADEEVAAKKPTAKKTTSKKPATKKPATKKPSAKEAAANKAPAKKAPAKKPPAKKPATKTAAKKPAAKVAAKKPATKTAAKKPAAKKTTKPAKADT